MNFYQMKAIDALIIGALVFGTASVSAFALILIAAMVVLATLAVFLLTEEMALKLQEQSKFRSAIRYITYAAYTSALLVTGHPNWASAYVIVSTLLLIRAAHTVKGAA